jgi:hypothetical protein
MVCIAHRGAHTASSVTDPPRPLAGDPARPSISLSHPLDPQLALRANTDAGRPPRDSITGLDRDIVQPLDAQAVVKSAPSSDIPPYTRPPFHTYQFFVALEKTFPTETARNLMRATRALLVDRLGKVRRDGLTQKDLDNVCLLSFPLTLSDVSDTKQAYLFRAALSELRAELSMSTRNNSATIKSAVAALRREVDRLDGKMKEDVSALKHE